MNRAFFDKKENHTPRWHVIDGSGKVVGRLATQIADLLRGRGLPSFTPHADCGDYVVVINSDKVVFTGDKLEGKEYISYSGWRSGKKVLSPRQKFERDHEFVLQHAVQGMLPKNKLARVQIKRLKMYKGAEHPHAAQIAGFGEKAAA